MTANSPSVPPPESEVAIFTRLIDSEDQSLSPEVAQYILSLQFTLADRNQMHVLSGKVQEGTLTAEEHAEIDGYERVGHLLSIWKSKARQALKHRTSI